MKISSVLLYGCELLGVGNISEVEAIANKFYRILLGLPPKSSIDLARGELGRYSMRCKIYERIIKYWLKQLKSDPDSFIYELQPAIPTSRK